MSTKSLFRFRERRSIRKAITGQQGNLVEVFGPPMVGKSALIEQVIHDIQILDQSPDAHTNYHKVWCKNIYVLQDLFIEIVQVLAPNRHAETFYEMSFILNLIKKIVTRSDRCRHIFVFHKCENFHINGTSFALLSFLGEMVNMFQSIKCKVHIVFSTYKRFSLSGHKTTQVNVGVDINRYVYLCQRYLCLPKPIVQLAIRYISNNTYTPEELEQFLCGDFSFYSEIFDQRYLEVYNWLTKYELELTDMICGTGFNPFNKDDVESLTVYYERGDITYQDLRDSLVIEGIDHSNQLIVHPLVWYKCALDRPVNEHDTLYKTNSFKKFIGHVMMKAETNTEKHGTRGQTYGCHRLEFPYIMQLFQRAICGDFKDILRVSVVARRLIMALYPNEAKQFYSGLFEITQTYGSPSESAVMEACLGHIMATGAGVNFQSALEHLDSALHTLKHHGPTFFYKWALRRKAIILYRMSRNPKSKKYFQKAKAITGCVPLSPSDNEVLSVSLLQIEEDDIIGDIYEAIPMIFTGDNENALKKLLLVNETIHDRYENHPDLDVLLNNIGMALHGSYGDLHGALLWYNKSLKHRSLLIKINPQVMLVTLNNIAMIKLQIGDLVGAESDLQTAITIIREGIWYHYNTALTLTSLAEVKVKLGKFQEAYDSLLKADEILLKIYKNNDYRLKINLGLFHYKWLVDHKDGKDLGTDSMDRDIERMVDLGFSINKHINFDSHHHLLSVYEHGMVVNWGVSEDKVRAHKDMLLRHVEDNAVVKDLLEKTDLSPERQSVLKEHRHFLDYIKNTELKDLELEKLLDHLKLSCITCTLINKVLEKEMWLKDYLQAKSKPANKTGEILLYNVNRSFEATRMKRIASHLSQNPLSLNIINPSHSERATFRMYVGTTESRYCLENFNGGCVVNPSGSFIDHNRTNVSDMSGSSFGQTDLLFTVNNPSLASERGLLSSPVFAHSLFPHGIHGLISHMIANPSNSTEINSFETLAVANPSLLFEPNCRFLSHESGCLNVANPSILYETYYSPVTNPSSSFGLTVSQTSDIFHRPISFELNSTQNPYYFVELGSFQNLEAGNAFNVLVPSGHQFNTVYSSFEHHYMNPSSRYTGNLSLPLGNSAASRAALEDIHITGCHVCQEHHGESFPSNPVYCLGSGLYTVDVNAQRGEDETSLLTLASPPQLDNAVGGPVVPIEHLEESGETDSS